MKRKIPFNKQIATKDLGDIEIPDATASKHDLFIFASSFNGYKYKGNLHNCAKASMEIEMKWFKDKGYLKLVPTDDLRSALYWEFRSLNWEATDDETFMRALVEEIKSRIPGKIPF